VDFLAVEGKSNGLVVGNKGCVEDCDVVVVKAEETAVERVGDGFAGRERGEVCG